MALPAGALTATVTVGAPIDIAGAAGTLASLTVRPEVPAGLVWAATGDMIEPWSASGAGTLTILADQPGVLTSGTLDGAASMVVIRSWPLVAIWYTRQGANGAPTKHVRRFAAPAPGVTVDLDLLPQGGTPSPGTLVYGPVTVVAGGTGAVGATYTDNGDGTYTLSGPAVIDNGDGTYTLTV